MPVVQQPRRGEQIGRPQPQVGAGVAQFQDVEDGAAVDVQVTGDVGAGVAQLPPGGSARSHRNAMGLPPLMPCENDVDVTPSDAGRSRSGTHRSFVGDRHRGDGRVSSAAGDPDRNVRC